MIAWFPENIPNIPKIPTHFGMPGIWLSHTYIYISKVKFNASLCISVCKGITKYPREAGDFGDIGDIFRKPLKLLDFLSAHGGDISGDIFGDGDIPGDIFWDEDFHAQDTLACALRWRLDAIGDGDIPGDIFWDEDFHAQDTLACAPHRSIRCGEPLLPGLRTQAEFGVWSKAWVVPAKGNRFRFGNGSAFPNRRHGDH